jgi:RNA polymerase sigma-70 factor (ECF subfamily)
MDAATTAANPATSADDALVRRARRGDAAAFAVLVDTRIDRCYRLAWSILSNDADAADATQDALVSAWRQLPRLRRLGRLCTSATESTTARTAAAAIGPRPAT